jgi:hypothetical protein
MIPVDDVFNGIGVRINLKTRDDFLKVRETLTRMGVASRHEKTLYQSCHILHKKGQYAIVHFKELFKLDGKPTNITDEDIARRNTIANILSEWGLVELVDAKKSQSPVSAPNQIKIIAHKEKNEWTLVAKYNIGGKKLH